MFTSIAIKDTETNKIVKAISCPHSNDKDGRSQNKKIIPDKLKDPKIAWEILSYIDNHLKDLTVPVDTKATGLSMGKNIRGLLIKNPYSLDPLASAKNLLCNSLSTTIRVIAHRLEVKILIFLHVQNKTSKKKLYRHEHERAIELKKEIADFILKLPEEDDKQAIQLIKCALDAKNSLSKIFGSSDTGKYPYECCFFMDLSIDKDYRKILEKNQEMRMQRYGGKTKEYFLLDPPPSSPYPLKEPFSKFL